MPGFWPSSTQWRKTEGRCCVSFRTWDLPEEAFDECPSRNFLCPSYSACLLLENARPSKVVDAIAIFHQVLHKRLPLLPFLPNFEDLNSRTWSAIAKPNTKSSRIVCSPEKWPQSPF